MQGSYIVCLCIHSVYYILHHMPLTIASLFCDQICETACGQQAGDRYIRIVTTRRSIVHPLLLVNCVHVLPMTISLIKMYRTAI